MLLVVLVGSRHLDIFAQLADTVQESDEAGIETAMDDAVGAEWEIA